MKIIIVGDGKVGYTLTDKLSREGHDVTVIDNNPAALKNTTDRHDVIGIAGNGATFSVQQEAGADKADLLIAATSADELNLLCCMVAKKLGTQHTIARVRNPEYSEQMSYLKDELYLSMHINPELAAAEEISRILRFPSVIKIEPFSKGKAELVEIRLAEGNPLIGVSLNALQNKFQVKVLVCAVKRGEAVYIPKGDFVLEENDKISISASPSEISALFRKLNLVQYKVKNVMIAGGGRIAYYLTRQLATMGIKVKIIENDPERCRELTSLLPATMVIYSNASDKEMLHEEGLEDMDAFVALTGLDEENIIISLYASACGVPKVITKVSNIAFPAMLEKLGLDTVVSPKDITADQIVRYVRAMENSVGSSMESLYKIANGEVEAMEFRIRSGLPFLGTPLKDLRLKKEVLIACIVRNGKTIIPGGNTTIEAGDSVIVVTANEDVRDLMDIVD
ncbi:MAG: Trk system potassium uptake protein TrkA [Firmicutes bacterium ADurb.Bin182]|nr:MAG: Trk system potassium uptake protein TrkA [Firmicutes bacterium ADurb.Bin182]